MVNQLIQIQGTMFVYMLCGFFLKMTHMIDEKASSFLSCFILDFIFPVNIFYSCMSAFTIDALSSVFYVLLVAIVVELVIYIVTRLNFLKVTDDQMRIARYGLLVSNGGFIGTALVDGLYGASGVMYANIYLIPQRILAFSAGESIFNPSKKKIGKEIIQGILANKILMALVVGILFAVMDIQFPVFLDQAIVNISKCMSPLSLILIGSFLADQVQLNRKEDIHILGIAVCRQLFIPLALLFCLKGLAIEPMIQTIMVLLVGMPVATTTAIFAHKYHCEVGFATKTVVFSTISSLFTLVFLMMLLES